MGTPVTWCHRMVVCTKKNGLLRRTIDLQLLNKHATRETHHCPSSFHQARNQEDSFRRVEWLPLCGSQGGRSTLHDLYHGIVIVQHRRAIQRQATPIRRDKTPWCRRSSQKPNASMTLFCGLPASSKPSTKRWNGWTHVQQTESH